MKGRVMWFLISEDRMNAMNCESASIADGKLSINFDGGSRVVDLYDIREIRIFPHGYRNNRKTPPRLEGEMKRTGLLFFGRM